jgi:hypothetical protein
LILDDWQQHVLNVGLGERADGKWSAFEVGLIVGRQNGKGHPRGARAGRPVPVRRAADFAQRARVQTAQEAFRRVLSLVQNTPDLEKLVSRVRTSHGEEGIELGTGPGCGSWPARPARAAVSPATW